MRAFARTAFQRSGKNNRELSVGRVEKDRRCDPLARRRRWLLAAAVLLGWAGVVAGVSSPHLATVGQVDAAGVPGDGASGWNISQLSQGAPPGAITLANAPVTSGNAQPAAATVVTGLAANGIPNVALNAYRVAAARMDNAQPGCGIDWSLLAGIGRVESNHGRFGGAVLNPDGTSTPEIRGPALNGVSFAFIRDSDNGVYDHDPAYDRAVGPMQFIPTTWRSYAIDADGDHATNPFDIDDASLGAAHYLCVAGGDLTTASGQRDAVMAYNHSDSYVAQVLALAHAYASGIRVDDLPLNGNVVSPVPPATGNFRAPASPGPAIGAGDMTPASGNTVGAQDSTGPGSTATGQQAASPDGGTPPPAGTGSPNATANSPAQQAQQPAQPAKPAQPGAPPPANLLPNVPAAPPAAGPAVVDPPVVAPPVVAPPPAPAPIPGVTCTTLDPLGHPLVADLPVCP